MGSAVADGRPPREVKGLIRDRLAVSESKARAFAQTDITDSLRQARWAEDDAATEQFGLDLRELHTSALLPTTRPTHAARHGKVYTTQEMRDWYAKDGNRMNCHCSSTTCLIDSDGKPILTDGLKKKMAREVKDWKPAMPV
ncbi:phage minor head protein [Roseateles sp. LKC17W]|uniref:Phage minor head protein n=1 Tax=Pelomonas margarita TaxID=3299031 RepID=A0ABW7FIE2_9BURK